MLYFVSQPVDNQQALVRRESVVNLENFKKQYVRRRWKVCQGFEFECRGCRGPRWFLVPSRCLYAFSPGHFFSLPSSALFQHRLLV